jgi:hypothetical protein
MQRPCQPRRHQPATTITSPLRWVWGIPFARVPVVTISKSENVRQGVLVDGDPNRDFFLNLILS